MELLKQTDKELFPVIQKVGCFFRSAQALAELQTGKTLTVRQINSQWLLEKQRGFIDEKNCMKASAPIANKALTFLSHTPGKFFEVGIFKDGKTTFYESIPARMRSIDFLIQKVKTEYEVGTHFRVVDRFGKVIFDPDPSVKAVKVLYSILYCYEDYKG